MLLALVAAEANAQEEICPGPLSVDAVRLDLDEVESALRDLDGDAAARALDEVMDNLRCVDGALYPEDVARVARLASLIAFFHQDKAEEERWGLLWLSVAPDVGPMVKRSPVPEEWTAHVQAVPSTEIGGPDGNLAPPPKGVITADGRALTAPRVAIGIPHFMQVFDKKGRVVDAFWQDGIVFPDAWLGGDGPVDVPDWWNDQLADRTPAPAPVVEAPAPAPAPDVPVPTPIFDAPPKQCAWGTVDPTDVVVHHGEILVDGTSFPIRTDDEQAAFRKTLRSCHEFRASRRFDRWIEARGHLFSGEAKKQKEAMVRYLVQPEPDAPGKKVSHGDRRR